MCKNYVFYITLHLARPAAVLGYVITIIFHTPVFVPLSDHLWRIVQLNQLSYERDDMRLLLFNDYISFFYLHSVLLVFSVILVGDVFRCQILYI